MLNNHFKVPLNSLIVSSRLNEIGTRKRNSKNGYTFTQVNEHLFIFSYNKIYYKKTHVSTIIKKRVKLKLIIFCLDTKQSCYL